MRTGFTVAEAALVSGLSERQVRTLAGGCVPPSLRGPSGRGSVVFFDAFDLLKLLCVAQLAELTGEVRAGLAAQVTAAVDASRPGGVRRYAVLADADGAQLIPAAALPAALERAGAALVLQLAELQRTLDSRLARRLGLAPAA